VRRSLVPLGLLLLCAAGAFGAGGCKQNSTEVAGAADGGGSDGSAPLAHAPIPSPVHDADSTILPEGWEPAIAPRLGGGPAAGKMDVSNRYASTIMLLVDGGHVHANCSGILLSRRVALTAASCVCPPRQATSSGVPEKGPIGPSACAERAFIKTVRLGAVESSEFKEESVEQTFGRVDGKVRVHPAFKLEVGDQGAVLSTHADLAIIVLDSPVRGDLQRVPFAETEVQENETLVMAGYGDDPRFLGVAGIRYFRHNKVTQVRGGSDGKVLYEQQGAFVYNGYTGGPCFREDKSQRWLVGIASVGSDQELSFTSTYFFRDWLRTELQRVAIADSPSTPASQHPR
jgi:hypothetical protein